MVKWNNFLTTLFFTLLLFFSMGSVEGIVIGEEKPSLVDTVVITNSKWVDAIAATEYAYESGGVILQTENNELDPRVESLIKAIAPKRIVIIGGPLAVSNNVENKLKKYGTVVRIWGPTRVETSENILRVLENKNTLVLVNSSNFSEVMDVISKGYTPVYCFITRYNPYDVIRVYGDNKVKLYNVKNGRFIGEYDKENVLEVPGSILVLRRPDIFAMYSSNRDICKFGYTFINFSDNDNTISNNFKRYKLLISEDSPTVLLLSKYLKVPLYIEGRDRREGHENYIIEFGKDPIDSSINVAVNILVIKKTLKLYEENNNLSNLEQSLNEAKTQLWSKNIPIDRYNIPYSCLEEYWRTK